MPQQFEKKEEARAKGRDTDHDCTCFLCLSCFVLSLGEAAKGTLFLSVRDIYNTNTPIKRRKKEKKQKRDAI